jgi:hypothetical protein
MRKSLPIVVASLVAALLVTGIALAGWPGSGKKYPPASGFVVQNSVVLNGSTQYLSWITGATATKQNTWTVSLWFKRGAIGSVMPLYSTAVNPLNNIAFGSDACGSVTVDHVGYEYNSGATCVWGSAAYADTTTWHHLAVGYDSTQATAANRVHIYLDGAEASYSGTTYPALNAIEGINATFKTQRLGNDNNVNFFNGKIAEFYIIDGQQLSYTSFVTAGPHPKAYTGTFGTLGVYLNFQNSGALGTDSSGNGNTMTNHSATQSFDVPL